MQQLYKNLDYSKTDKQGDIVKEKISDLKKGSVDQTEFDFFRQTLLEKNSKPYRYFYKQRVFAIKKKIAEKSGTDLGEITEVERLFTLYCARRGSDAVYAYRKFQTGIDQYAKVLKSGNGERIWNFSNSISQKLGTAPEQKEQMAKNAKVTGFSPTF